MTMPARAIFFFHAVTVIGSVIAGGIGKSESYDFEQFFYSGLSDRIRQFVNIGNELKKLVTGQMNWRRKSLPGKIANLVL